MFLTPCCTSNGSLEGYNATNKNSIAFFQVPLTARLKKKMAAASLVNDFLPIY